jgi:hypothetical protein
MEMKAVAWILIDGHVVWQMIFKGGGFRQFRQHVRQVERENAAISAKHEK